MPLYRYHRPKGKVIEVGIHVLNNGTFNAIIFRTTEKRIITGVGDPFECYATNRTVYGSLDSRRGKRLLSRLRKMQSILESKYNEQTTVSLY